MIDNKQIPDYSTEFNKTPWLIEFLKNSDYVNILETNDTQFNEIENVGFDLYFNTWLNTAEGAQLDVIGKIINISRQGRDDEAYKSLIQTKIQINIASGEPESVINAVKIIFETENVEYYPEYPGKFRIWTDGTLAITKQYDLIDDLGNNIIDNLGNNIIVNTSDYNYLNLFLGLIPAGVGMLFSYNIIDNNGNLLIDNLGNEIVGTQLIL